MYKLAYVLLNGEEILQNNKNNKNIPVIDVTFKIRLKNSKIPINKLTKTI